MTLTCWFPTVKMKPDSATAIHKWLFRSGTLRSGTVLALLQSHSWHRLWPVVKLTQNSESLTRYTARGLSLLLTRTLVLALESTIMTSETGGCAILILPITMKHRDPFLLLTGNTEPSATPSE
ncbi:hypothetical protein Pelo_405 [Pelomyxa schiedti]|nr:hypothetical protein Pelo_405 [Pelomyxa schiedti]